MTKPRVASLSLIWQPSWMTTPLVDVGQLPGRPCSIAATLSLVGANWSLLVIRELSLGNQKFNQLATNTGAPRDILTSRLRSLEKAGIIHREEYSDRPRRYLYRLTESGRELLIVIAALRDWGDQWAVSTPPTEVTHTCGHRVHVTPRCEHCHVEVNLTDSDAVEFRSLNAEWSRSGPEI